MKKEERRLELITLTPLSSLTANYRSIDKVCAAWRHDGSAGSHLY